MPRMTHKDEIQTMLEEHTCTDRSCSRKPDEGIGYRGLKPGIWELPCFQAAINHLQKRKGQYAIQSSLYDFMADKNDNDAAPGIHFGRFCFVAFSQSFKDSRRPIALRTRPCRCHRQGLSFRFGYCHKRRPAGPWQT